MRSYEPPLDILGFHRNRGIKMHGLIQWVFIGLAWSVAVSATDLAREQRIHAELEGFVLVGESITLKGGGNEFLAIHTAASTPKALGGVILAHGRGANPDWNDVIQPLRIGLPEHGWETLSLQMPLAAADAAPDAYEALIPEAFPRLTAASEMLNQQGTRNQVVIGHSLGARMVVGWLAQDPPPSVRAGVLVGLAVGPDEAGTLKALERIKIPLLDIYGSRDLDSVMDSAPARAAAARRGGNPDYRQLEIAGADHFFRGQETLLLARVRAWLARVAAIAPPG